MHEFCPVPERNSLISPRPLRCDRKRNLLPSGETCRLPTERGTVTCNMTPLRSEQPGKMIRRSRISWCFERRWGGVTSLHEFPPFQPLQFSLGPSSNLESIDRSRPKAVAIPGVVGKALCVRQEEAIAQTPISGKQR